MKSELWLESLRQGCGRPPRGGRGLKSISDYQLPSALVSPPSRGAWIEIKC